jgi:hypothetical protein
MTRSKTKKKIYRGKDYSTIIHADQCSITIVYIKKCSKIGIHCTEVIESGSLTAETYIILDARAYSITVENTDTSVTISNDDLWTDTFWSKSGTYQVTYSLKSTTHVVTLLIVDTLTQFSIDAGFLVIDAPDFDNASLVRYRLDRQAKMTAAHGTDTVYSNSNDELVTHQVQSEW